jgi:hypothetical protein
MLVPSMSHHAAIRRAQSRPSGATLSMFCISLSLGLFISTCPTAVAAEEKDSGSMDSIWVDQSVRNNAKADAPSTDAAKPSAAGTAVTATTGSAANTTLDTAAPMCTLSAFKDSPLATGSGWVGLGPFKSGSDSSEFVDEKRNRVKLDLTGDQITRAELTINGTKQSAVPGINMLNLQMNIDFLLESVGIRANRIQAINAQIEHEKDALLNGNDPVTINAGRYSLNVEKHNSGNTVDYVIAVNSMDANKKVIRQPWVSMVTPKDVPSKIEEHVTPQTDSGKPAAGADHTQLKGQFAELIGNWQKVKKEAVKTRQAEQLGTVLSGKALTRQTDAVKWLVTNHRYYDMTPKGVVVEQFTEILPAKKYMVAAQVHEAYKFIDEQTGKVLKEVDDINKVNYTVEKQGGKWVISDSVLLSANNNKTSATNKISR